MSKLKKWMNDNEVTVIDMAIKLRMDRTTIYKYIDGSRQPSLKTAIEIEKITDGEVTPSDMLKD